MTKEFNKEEKLKRVLRNIKYVSYQNLEDLYDKEGYRDEEFDKDDKGTWLLHSEMAIQRKGEDLETRGMVLKINRNTQTSKGDYITNKITYDNKGRPQNNKKKYPVKMENNKIIPIKNLKIVR